MLVKKSKKENKKLLDRINSMFRALKQGKREVQPSKMWIELNKLNMSQLKEYGFENFKHTVVHSYFAVIPFYLINRQTLFLILHINPIKTILSLIKSFYQPKNKYLSYINSVSSTFITYMIWDYVKTQDKKKLLTKLDEPIAGNPPLITVNNKLISQDLANSVMEYYSIMEKIKEKTIKVIGELGAGNGRNAYIFLSLYNVKYIIIDIPPALAIAEKYLSTVFSKKKIFRYRQFSKFSDIEKEFYKSDILFFLPSQIELLPSHQIDLFINISSLHEMRLDQIRYYFKQIERLTKTTGYFYFKQWKVGQVSYENQIIRFEDYPISKKWKILYNRQAKIQTKFFECLLRLG